MRCLTEQQARDVIASLCETTLPGVESSLVALLSVTNNCCNGCAGHVLLSAFRTFAIDRVLQQVEATQEERDELHQIIIQYLVPLIARRDEREAKRRGFGAEPSEN